MGDCSPVHRLGCGTFKTLLSFRSDLFDITDANEDGKITMEEWLNSPVRSTSVGETYSMLVKHWAKFDPANVGYLTKSQVINRKA